MKGQTPAKYYKVLASRASRGRAQAMRLAQGPCWVEKAIFADFAGFCLALHGRRHAENLAEDWAAQCCSKKGICLTVQLLASIRFAPTSDEQSFQSHERLGFFRLIDDMQNISIRATFAQQSVSHSHDVALFIFGWVDGISFARFSRRGHPFVFIGLLG